MNPLQHTLQTTTNLAIVFNVERLNLFVDIGPCNAFSKWSLFCYIFYSVFLLSMKFLMQILLRGLNIYKLYRLMERQIVYGKEKELL